MEHSTKIGGWFGYTFRVDDNFLEIKGPGVSYRLVRAHVDTVVLEPSGWGQSIFRVVGRGTTLASIKMATQWAEEAQTWVLRHCQGESQTSSTVSTLAPSPSQSPKPQPPAKEQPSPTKGVAAVIVTGVILVTMCNSLGTVDKKSTSVPETKAAADTQTVSTTEPQKAEVKSGPSLEEQQAAYKEWRTKFDRLSKGLDDANEVWAKVFEGLSKGTISRYSAYDTLSKMEPILKEIKGQAYGLKSPTILGTENRKALDKASESLGTAAFTRERAARYALEVLDTMKPSAVQKVKEEMEMSNAFIIEAAANAIQVEFNLGLLK